MRFSEAIDNYRQMQLDKRLSNRTIEDNHTRLFHLCDFLKNPVLEQITPSQIHDYFDHLKIECGLAEATRANRKSAIRAFFNWLVEEKVITHENDPSRVLLSQAHNYSFEPKSRKPAAADHLMAVLQAIPSYMAKNGYRERAVRDALVVSLAADSAARRKAIWSIRRSHLLAAVSGDPPYVIYSVESKTMSERIVFFEETANIARMYLTITPKKYTWLFTNYRTEKRHRIDGFHKCFWRLCDFAGVPRFSFQAVRKRDVIDAIKAAGDITAGQRYAGHKSQRTTSIYYNMIKDEEVNDIASEISERRRGGTGDLPDQFFGKK